MNHAAQLAIIKQITGMNPAAQLTIIKQMISHETWGTACDYQAAEQALIP